jgi:DNA polymerase-1
MKQKPVLLIDGMNMLIRHTMINFHSINGAGQCIGGVEGCLREILHLVRDFRPKAVFFIAESGSLRKTTLFSDYKKHRKLEIRAKSSVVKEESEVRSMLNYQLNVLGTFLPYLKIHYVYVPFVEADDVVAVLSHVMKPNIIISNDTDFLQLHNFTDTFVYDPRKKKILEATDIKSFGEEYAVLKSVIGDKSDNIKGIGRVGWKTLLKWKQENIVESLEKLLELAREKDDKLSKKIIAEYEIIKRNYELICLKPEITYNQEMQKVLLDVLSQPAKINFSEAIKVFKHEGLNMNLIMDNAMMLSILEA